MTGWSKFPTTLGGRGALERRVTSDSRESNEACALNSTPIGAFMDADDIEEPAPMA
ncbi:hypothetical protein PHLCEN_2v10363 [Hermanssonia centrifuga]|uniref:Uncharacterized protein n=1 Tax=Hermanssonia centrifuga TaxID=98765 RepID=A0A2R6NP19_9APHY|nr:hypothetical protein PHLCEN_2v10363 [Hermanssonia centrifuga]